MTSSGAGRSELEDEPYRLEMRQAAGNPLPDVGERFVLDQEGAVIVCLRKKRLEINPITCVSKGARNPAFSGADSIFQEAIRDSYSKEIDGTSGIGGVSGAEIARVVVKSDALRQLREKP